MWKSARVGELLILHFNFSGKAAVARVLLENGANVNAVSKENFMKRTPLHEASKYGTIQTNYFTYIKDVIIFTKLFHSISKEHMNA